MYAPLALIAFNRPDLLRQQLQIVRQHHRGRIFAIVDGPRAGRVGEEKKVDEVVALFEGLRDSFGIEINRSDQNLGCHRRIKSGLDWVFSQVDRAIILEDDCIPSPQFFGFASENLERYADDKRVFSISGTNLFPHLSPLGQSHFITRYHNCWGWATWARAWKHFIDDDAQWKQVRTSTTFRRSFLNYRSFFYWRKIFDRTYKGEINSWFYRWMLSCWQQNGHSLVPVVNLIQNCGDGVEASNTRNSAFMRRKIQRLPQCKVIDALEFASISTAYDIELENKMYSKSLLNRIFWMFKKFKQ